MMDIHISATVICKASLWGSEGSVIKINKFDAYRNLKQWSKCLKFDLDEKAIKADIQTLKSNNKYKNVNVSNTGCGCS